MRCVTMREFAGIACNRCGQCCEGMSLDHDPHVLLARVQAGETCLRDMTPEQSERECQAIADMLDPVGTYENGAIMYGCKHFRRDSDGMGVCGIYDERPRLCSAFPYGRPSTGWAQCAWNVRIVPRSLPMLRSIS